MAVPDQEQQPQAHPQIQRLIDAAQTGAVIQAGGAVTGAAVVGPGAAVAAPPVGVVTTAADVTAHAAKWAIIVAVLRRLFAKHHAESADYLTTQLRKQFPGADEAVIRQAVEQELRFERSFQQKALARVERDMQAIGGLSPEAARAQVVAAGGWGTKARQQRARELRSQTEAYTAAMQRVMDREKRYSAMREQAMLARAQAAVRNAEVKKRSPLGAVWMLGPRKTHTRGCIALSGKAWPWEVLDTISPPIHRGCGCFLRPLTAEEAGGPVTGFTAAERAEIKQSGGWGTKLRQAKAAEIRARPNRVRASIVPPAGEAMRLARAALAMEEAIRAVADNGEIEAFLAGEEVRPSVARAISELQEIDYQERLHPRGRGGRWIHILGKLKAAKMDDITDVEGHSVMRLKGEGYSVRVGAGERVRSKDPEKIADAIERHLDYRATLGEPVTLDNMDERIKTWFTPDQLEGGKETHPRSGYDVHVGKWRSPITPERGSDGPPLYKVTDYGDHAGDLLFPKDAGTEPIRRVYRGMSVEEWNQAVGRGYVQSDMRGVIAGWEGTNAAADPRSAVSYLPRDRESVIAQIDVRPEEEWFTRNEDDYLRTRKEIPLSQVSAVSPVLYKDSEEGLFVRSDSTSAAKLTSDARERAGQAEAGGPGGGGGRGRRADLVRLAEVDASTEAGYRRYVAALRGNPRAEFVTEPTQDELAAKRVWMSPDDTVGVTVSADGEVGNLFANPGAPRGAGGQALDHAVANGGTWLNCFDGKLPEIYKKHGFVEVARISFERDFKPEGWDVETQDDPDVVFMGHGIEPQPVQRFAEWDDAERAVLNRVAGGEPIQEAHWIEWLHPRGRGGQWIDAIHHYTNEVQREQAEVHEHFTGEDFVQAMDGFEHGGIVAVRTSRTKVQNLYGEAWLNLYKKGQREPVGLARAIVRPPNSRGERVAEFANMYLQESEQNKGFGRAFTDHLFDTLRKGGVDKVEVEAVSVGGYAWARRGFVWTADKQAEQRRILADAKADGRWAEIARHAPPAVVKGLERKVAAGEFSSEAELAAWGLDQWWPEEELEQRDFTKPAPEVRRTWAGKELMIGSRWKGERSLTQDMR